MEVPATPTAVVIVAFFVLPGLAYAGVRAFLRGPRPSDLDISSRVAEALLVSVIWAVMLLLALGDRVSSWLVNPFSPPHEGIRSAALVTLLAILGPGLIAGLLFGWKRPGTVRPEPTAWDRVAPQKGGHFIRILRARDREWFGGWWGNDSYASMYPHPRDIFIQSQWNMGERGEFLKKRDLTAGLWLQIEDGDVVEFLEPPSKEDK